MEVHLRRQVRDPVLREKLQPGYPIGCKRILFSNDWYPALARDHVDVVTEAVSAVEPGRRARADGTLHHADVLIWGTGFAATDFLGRSTSPAAAAPTSRDVGGGRPCAPRDHRPRLPQPLLRLRPQHQPRRRLDHRHAGGAGRLDRPGRPADRRRCRTGLRGAAGRLPRLRPRDAVPPRRQRLVRLRQLVHRRRADHDELARAGRGVPVSAARGRLVRAGGRPVTDEFTRPRVS